MLFGKTKMELKVGIFVFVGAIILGIFILSIGKFKTWTAGYEVNFIFNFINGAKIGCPVRFAGMDAGEVKKINLHFSQAEQKFKVKMVCWLKNDVKVPKDSTVWVNTLGLLGEKYIEIIPGKDYLHALNPQESLVGVDPLPMHELVRLGKDVTDNLNASIAKIRKGEGTIGKLIADDKVYNEIEAMVTDLRKNPWKLFWKTKEKK